MRLLPESQRAQPASLSAPADDELEEASEGDQEDEAEDEGDQEAVQSEAPNKPARPQNLAGKGKSLRAGEVDICLADMT